MRLRKLFIIPLIAALACMPGAGSAFAAEGNASIEELYGTYVGQAEFEQNGEITERDLNVVIKPSQRGFTVEWTTVSRRADGSVKRASYNINFRETRRDGIFESAMKMNKFGKGVPLDPIKGDPYVWAQLQGKTLTVYAMIITDAGGYEMQTYERTLVNGGMKLNFSRVRDGEPMRSITATLKRQDN